MYGFALILSFAILRYVNLGWIQKVFTISPTMLDYCNNTDGNASSYQTPSPSMASFFNMGMTSPLTSHDTQQRQSAFVLSSPQLAALQNLTELKAPISSSSSTDSTSLSSPFSSQSTLKHLGFPWAQSHGAHRISDILCRPLGMPGLNAGMYLHPQSRLSKLAELPGRPPIYWPGIVNNAAWRPTGTWRSV